MNKLIKFCILSIILIFLSISFASASEIDSDDIQIAIDDDIQEISIDEVSLNEENQSSISYSIQMSNENEENNSSGNAGIDDESVDNDVLSASSSGTVHKVSPSNYSKYFNKNGYVNTSVVKSGDIIDLSGNFNKVNFTFTIPCSITSSQKNAYLNNCVVYYFKVNSTTYSNVSNLKFTVNLEFHPSVYINQSSHVNVFNCNAYSTAANSNPALLVGSTYCNIHNNVFETTFAGYMNMSWKRAGILLGESHYNNIYSNDVTVKDSNGIYLTTYGWEKSNYNNIYNNTIRSSAISEETGLPNPSAWAYGIHLMGDYNKAINNTIYLMYRGVDSEGSFNEIIGNDIYALAGSYYEGNNGTDGGEYGIHASYDNTIINNTIHDSKITGSAIYVAVNCTAYGNVIQNISGEHGFEFSISASNALVENNIINMSSGNGMYIRGNMTNVTVSNNIIDTKNGTAILIKKLSKAKYPDKITLMNNRILEKTKSFIDFSDVESNSNITTFNNSLYVTNASFFNVFDRSGYIKDLKAMDNLILKGDFVNLGISYINLNRNISLIGENSNILNIPFTISSSNLKIENLKITLNNQKDAFKFNNAQNISFSNNTIIINSENYALVLNNSNLSIVDNIITINADNPAILNDNGSYILFGENIISSLNDLEILSLHDSTVKYTFYILTEENFNEFFNRDGLFNDDFDIAMGDTLKIANLTNKTFRIDIPLDISAFQGSSLNNCTIILEGEASNTNISNLRFRLENNHLSNDFSFIIIKDGLSNLIIKNNQFNVSNIDGDYPLSAIKLIGSDYSANNNKLFNNIFNLNADLDSIIAINVLNENLANYQDITNDLSILNNSISIHNGIGTAYGIYIRNSNNLKIESNSISSIGDTGLGIYLEKMTRSNIKDNYINVSGFNYQRLIDYLSSIGTSSTFDVRNYVYENLISIDAAIYQKNSQKTTIRNNNLYENRAFTNLIHSNNPTMDIQSIIDSSNSGDIVYLGNNLYSIKDSIVINKSLSLLGGIILDNIDSDSNQLVSNDNPIFIIESKGTINLLNMTVIMDNNDLFALSLLKNSTDSTELDFPTVNIKNNVFLKDNDNVEGESISLIKSIAERPLLKPINNFNLDNNDLIENMDSIRYYVADDSSSNEINLNNGIKTVIISNNLVCTALDKDIYGSAVKYFEVKLLDLNNNPLSNKTVHISLNNKVYDLLTDSRGVVKLPVSINGYGIHNLLISFLGDSDYLASFSSGKITVNKQKATLIAPNKSYLVTANKYLIATFKDANGKLIKNKKIGFILNGKTYTAYTNSKGIAKIKVKISKAKTYIVTVKYAGDNVYSPISKSFKVYVKKVKTKLVVKNRSYKKSKKIKKLTATLKTKSGKAIAKKKLTFIVNGKKYKAKTNKKGVATVKVKVSKRKTYKFTVKFAGDNTYFKVSKKAKLRIK